MVDVVGIVVNFVEIASVDVIVVVEDVVEVASVDVVEILGKLVEVVVVDVLESIVVGATEVVGVDFARSVKLTFTRN